MSVTADVLLYLRRRWGIAVGAVTGDILFNVIVWPSSLLYIIVSPIVIFLVLSFVFWFLSTVFSEPSHSTGPFPEAAPLPDLPVPDIPSDEPLRSGYVTEESS